MGCVSRRKRELPLLASAPRVVARSHVGRPRNNHSDAMLTAGKLQTTQSQCAGTSSWWAPAPSGESPTIGVEHNGVLQAPLPPMRNSEKRLHAAVHALLTDELAESKQTMRWNEPTSIWQTIARRVRRSGVLRVSMLGASTLNGCGSRHPEKRCDSAFSWSRRTHDALQAHLNASKTYSHVTVRSYSFAKNAVSPTYFARCTSSFLRSDADVVLFEAGINMYDNKLGLDQLHPVLRATAPNAAISLMFFTPPGGEKMRMPVVMEAERFGADVVDASKLTQRLNHTMDSCLSATGWEWRHSDWFQDHHPSGIGHQLIGELVARYIDRRLAAAHHHARDAASLSPLASSPSPPPPPPPPPGTAEICLNSADQLDVVNSKGNWALVNDAPPDKGVKKLGWASSRPGDYIDFGVPAALQPSSYVRCSTVRLGYLLSSRPGQGSLHISCLGSCACSIEFKGPQARHMAEMLAPFPLVPTRCNKWEQCPSDRDVSVTALTEFTMMHRNPSKGSCQLRVTHHASAHADKNPNSTRVRVDGMSFHPADCAKKWGGRYPEGVTERDFG